MRKTAGIFLFSLMLACGNADRTPPDVLPKAKMRDILLDMNYADVAGRDQIVDTAKVSDTVREERVKAYYVQILQLHGVTREEFIRSYKFYEAHPDRFEAIYKEMGEIVRRRREVMDSTDNARRDREAREAGVKTRRDSLFWPSSDSLKLILP
ncbi:DUF4296 domain-containing protein [Chitinophaga sp. GCM10012297]|uniref:DUF4296 domain-containing protein n=1 Tax=Chitinophaga chungangae TaxID=2821488 RepID=A0ABS3Y7I9_9BACT|nr:DUF4296 domain-containing protein [Chitinophaga chungangae]MBO9150627.1 DUF4296 domain-containing protein [Chitinophaga chungangae]